jgi:translation initiation factor IF-2
MEKMLKDPETAAERKRIHEEYYDIIKHALELYREHNKKQENPKYPDYKIVTVLAAVVTLSLIGD